MKVKKKKKYHFSIYKIFVLQNRPIFKDGPSKPKLNPSSPPFFYPHPKKCGGPLMLT
jgi:hypothetical protein